MARESLVAEAADTALVDAFFDALWLEDGLSKNTLEAYRRDLRLFSGWTWPGSSHRATRRPARCIARRPTPGCSPA